VNLNDEFLVFGRTPLEENGEKPNKMVSLDLSSSAECFPSGDGTHATATARETPATPGRRQWSKFRRNVIEERGNKCEVCGAAALSKELLASMPAAERSRAALHLHHKDKQREQPQKMFWRSNVVVCCQPCHLELEAKRATAPKRKTHGPRQPGLFPNATARAGLPVPGASAREPKPEARTDSREHPDDAIPADKSVNGVNAILGTKNLSLKLRQQAAKLGMLPGSPRWRAYVLGTTAAAAKRNRERRTKSESL
jgi:hypothetical protein